MISKYFKLLPIIVCLIGVTRMLGAQSNQPIKKKKDKSSKTSAARSTTNRSFTDNSYTDDVRRFLINFNQSHRDAIKLVNKYRLTRGLWQEEIKKLEGADFVNKAKIGQFKSRLKTLKKQEKVAKTNQLKFEKYAVSLKKIHDISLVDQQKLISRIEEGYQKMPRVFDPSKKALADKKDQVVASRPKPNKARATKKQISTRAVATRSTTTTNSENYAVYDRSKDLKFNPPISPCSYSFKGIDEFLGKEKTEVQPEYFFSYTDPQLRGYLNGKEYIYCTAGLATSTGGLTTLNIEVSIRSQNAQREFGGLQKGNPLTIKLVNGEIVKLLSVNSDNGTLDQTTGLTVFRNQFLVQKGEEKSFLESEIDQVRLVWSNGYEDYDVFEVDFLMKQIHCLYNN